MDEQIALHAHASHESCPYCHDALAGDQETWPCDRCGTKLHADCFRENELACTVLGCPGQAVVPEGARREPRVLSAEEERARAERRARHRGRCPQCHEVISEAEEAWPCVACANRHHAECFRLGDYRCSVIGCRGWAALPSGARADRRGLAEVRREEKRVERRKRRERQHAAQRTRASEATAPVATCEAPVAREPSWARGPLGLVAFFGAFLLPVAGGLTENVALFGLSIIAMFATMLVVLVKHGSDPDV